MPPFREVDLHDFSQGAVQHHVYDFEHATRDVSFDEHDAGVDAEGNEIKELVSLNSDLEVHDALLSVSMPEPDNASCFGADQDLHGCITLAECHAMAKHFGFNLNPAITAAIQRLFSGRSKCDEKTRSHRSKTLEECVKMRMDRQLADNYQEALSTLCGSSTSS